MGRGRRGGGAAGRKTGKLPEAGTPRGNNRCYRRNKYMSMRSLRVVYPTAANREPLMRPLTLILAIFPSVALRSASSCSDQLRLLLIPGGRGLAPRRLVSLLSQPRQQMHSPGEATTSDRKRGKIRVGMQYQTQTAPVGLVSGEAF